MLNAQEVKKLNELMQVYRHGSVRKAKAMQVAVMRRLVSSKIAPNLESKSDRYLLKNKTAIALNDVKQMLGL